MSLPSVVKAVVFDMDGLPVDTGRWSIAPCSGRPDQRRHQRPPGPFSKYLKKALSGESTSVASP